MRFKRHTVSMAPHIRHGRTIRALIVATILALAPATLWAFFQFGLKAVLLVAVGVGAAVGTEALVNNIAGRPQTISDYHAALVGLMIALLVPAGAPWWLVVVAAVLAILVAKMVFGPLGGSPISPVVVGLLIVAISWPDQMVRERWPNLAPAAVHAENVAPPEAPQTAVTIDPSDAAEYSTLSLALGLQTGPIGVISPILLFLGGLFLVWSRAARWQGPAGFLLGMGMAAAIAHGVDPGQAPSATFQLFTGMAIFAAFFLCTEWSSTPVTPWGLFLYAFSAGALALLFRLVGHLPYGGVLFAVALMSLATPLFDRIAPTPYGKVVRHA